jgi:hypothetical protein
MISEKAERETLTVDRRSGKMTLNGGCHNAIHAPGERPELISLVIASQLSVPARNNSPPLGREKVITCYGIIGIVSLATSKVSAAIDLAAVSHLTAAVSSCPQPTFFW